MDKKEFIESLRNELKRGGIIRAITAQLKEEICSSYLRTCSPLPHFNLKYKIQSLEHIALRSLIFDFLNCDDLQLTLSVYSTETGLDNDPHHQHHDHHSNSYCGFMSANDICKAFEIKTESKFFKMMTSTKENNKPSKGAEHSMISKILSGIPSLINDVPTSACASTQTHGDDRSSSILLARKDLEDHLQQIKDKYNQQSELLSQSYRSSSEVLESQMFAFQRECEERERARMERELEVHKRTAVEAIKREYSEMYSQKMDESKRMLKAEYDRNLEQLIKKEEKVREEFLGREKEREKDHLADLHRLMREIEHFKKRENDNKSLLDVERRKLELEEQRVKNILLTAEMKLNFAETKEKEIRESMTNEYNRVRLAAKQTYDDASDSVKKQMEFYAVELDRLNALRRENENRLIAHEALEIDASRLRVENAELKTNLDAALAQLTSLKLSKEDAEQKASHKINLLQSEMGNLRNEVGTFQGLLVQSKNEVARVSERYERTNEGLEQKCNRLSLDLWNAKQEKQVSHDQIRELQKLLCRSEGALRNVHMYQHEEERSGIEGYHHKRQEQRFREVVDDTNIQERTNRSSSKFLVNGSSTTTKKHLTISTTASRKEILPSCSRGINFYRVVGDRSSSVTNTIDDPEDERIKDQVIEGYFIQEHEKQCFDTSNGSTGGGGGILEEMESNPLLQVIHRTRPRTTSDRTQDDKYDTIHITTSPQQLVDEDLNEVLNKEDDRKQPPLLGMIISEAPYQQQEERQSVEGKIEYQVDRRHSQKSKTLYNGENSAKVTYLKYSHSSDGTSTASRREDPNCDSSKKYQLPEMHSVTTSSEEFLPITCAEESTQDPSIRQTNDEDTYTMLEVEGRDDENYASDFEIESVSIA